MMQKVHLGVVVLGGGAGEDRGDRSEGVVGV